MKRNDILKLSNSREVYIWGARMTGMGAYRWLKARGILVKGFVDSDTAFREVLVQDCNVLSPSEFVDYYVTQENKPLIVIAVSLKEYEIRKFAAAHDISAADLVTFALDSDPYFTIDVMGTCNLRCSSCPHSIQGHNVPGGVMSLDTFEKVMNKISHEHPETTHVSLYSWGEPLLHPKIDEIVKYAHSKNVAVALSSNLSFSFEDRLKKLVLSAPDYLKISVSGYYPKAYNTTHNGGDINLVKSNLYKLRHFIDRYNSNILVDINYHLYRDNNNKNYEKFRELARELGFMISSVHALVMPLERVFRYIEGNPDAQTLQLQENLLVSIDEGIQVSKMDNEDLNGCPFRENQININADLTVPICCTVFERGNNVVAENFLESDLDEINRRKSICSTCQKCEKYFLPQYNMGFNKRLWDEVASKKTSLDFE